MIVLLLGPDESPLRPWLEDQGEQVVTSADPDLLPVIADHAPNVLVSYGYRYILKPDILRRFPGRAFNLHISYLPWNRGADPNLWSFLDETPKGVTIHHLDAGVDTGDIVAQRLVVLSDDETLRSSYERLHGEIQELFREIWPVLRSGRAPRQAQAGTGTTHRSRDKQAVLVLLGAGWDTPVRSLRRNT
jgi:methionyl-tRNA formyltransferase